MLYVWRGATGEGMQQKNESVSLSLHCFGFAFSLRSSPKGPRIQIIGLYGPNTIKPKP